MSGRYEARSRSTQPTLIYTCCAQTRWKQCYALLIFAARVYLRTSYVHPWIYFAEKIVITLIQHQEVVGCTWVIWINTIF